MKRLRIVSIAVALLTAVGVGMNPGLATSQSNADSAAGANPSTASALRTTCIRAALKLPVVRHTRDMTYDDNLLGNRAPRLGQSWEQKQHWRLVPAKCNGKFQRVSWIKPEVQNHRNHGQWQGVYRPRWSLIGAGNKGFGDQSDGNYVPFSDFSAQSMIVAPPKSSQTPYYRCTPGRPITKARVKLRIRVKSVKTGRFLAQRIGKFPTRVLGAC